MKPLAMLAGVSFLTTTGAARAETSEFIGTGHVQYHAVNKLHSVTGKSGELEVSATLDEHGLKASARAPATSFDSGNSKRDAHVQEIIGAQRFPWIVVDALEPGFQMAEPPCTQLLHLQAKVQIHGVTVSHSIEAVVDFRDSNHALVTFEFPESLAAHQIERPSLMFMSTNDVITIRGQARLERKVKAPANSAR